MAINIFQDMMGNKWVEEDVKTPGAVSFNDDMLQSLHALITTIELKDLVFLCPEREPSEGQYVCLASCEETCNKWDTCKHACVVDTFLANVTARKHKQ